MLSKPEDLSLSPHSGSGHEAVVLEPGRWSQVDPYDSLTGYTSPGQRGTLSQNKTNQKDQAYKPSSPAVGSQRQVTLCEFKASLIYIVSS